MIKITNGSRTTTVTMGAYREMYEPMGWKIADSCGKTTRAEEIPENVIKPDETAKNLSETVHDDVTSQADKEVEVPISEMKLDELKQYAAEHDIDISAAKTKQDIKAIIKAEMEG